MAKWERQKSFQRNPLISYDLVSTFVCLHVAHGDQKVPPSETKSKPRRSCRSLNAVSYSSGKEPRAGKYEEDKAGQGEEELKARLWGGITNVRNTSWMVDRPMYG